jgi:hypothetical protein
LVENDTSPSKQLEQLTLNTSPSASQPSFRRQATDIWTYFSGRNKPPESNHAKKQSLSSSRPPLVSDPASSWVHVQSDDTPRDKAKALTRAEMLESIKHNALDILAGEISLLCISILLTPRSKIQDAPSRGLGSTRMPTSMKLPNWS